MAKSQLYGNGEYIKEIDAMYALTVAILQVGFSFTNTAKVGDEFENSDILEIIDKFENIINS